MLNRLFRPRPAQVIGRALYSRAVAQARTPALYEALGAPDTAEGRFEIYTLHVVLVCDRLQNEGEYAAEVSQAVFDTYAKALDDALREMGVGDLSVGKKMRKLGEAFFGRAKSYLAAFAALPDRALLEALLARTVYAEAESQAPALADYVIARRRALAAQPVDRLLAGELEWGAP